MISSQKTLGLIAGNGKFPFLFARAAKQQGFKVVAAGIRGDTSVFLYPFIDKLKFFKVGQLKKLFEFFKTQGITQLVMAGQVNPNSLFDAKVRLDEEFQELFEALENRKADTIFSAVAKKLKENDMELLDSTILLKAYLAPAGTLTQRGPSIAELQDIEFGKDIAKSMGGQDVGQTVVVKQKAIVAIEAMEGTDKCILRGGLIAQEGAVIVKMSKPEQDLRFDVPVIGPKTIKHMIKAKADCLAIEASKTLIIDRSKSIKLANKHGICIVSS